jgi:hypothetical protein
VKKKNKKGKKCSKERRAEDEEKETTRRRRGGGLASKSFRLKSCRFYYWCRIKSFMADTRDSVVYKCIGTAEGDSRSSVLVPNSIMGPSTVTDNMNRRRIAHVLRAGLYLMSALSSVVIIIGCGLNDQNLKYSRTTSPTRSCKNELFILTVPDSQLCCETAFHDTDWVCVASYGTFDRIFTTMWALVIPLAPFAATVLSDALLSTNVNWSLNAKVHAYRLGIYVLIILHRMVSLNRIS